MLCTNLRLRTVDDYSHFEELEQVVSIVRAPIEG